MPCPAQLEASRAAAEVVGGRGRAGSGGGNGGSGGCWGRGSGCRNRCCNGGGVKEGVEGVNDVGVPHGGGGPRKQSGGAVVGCDEVGD